MSNIKDSLKKLRANVDTVKIELPDGDSVDIPIRGLTFTQLTNMAHFEQKDDSVGAADYLLYEGLRNGIPREGDNSLSDDELREYVDAMTGPNAFEIIQKIRDLSGIAEGDKKNLISTAKQRKEPSKSSATE